MAFQSNILGLQSNLAAGCTLLAIDNSNYDTNGQSRFVRAQWNNLYVWVTRPDASEYVFGSGTLITVDETIAVPSGLSAPQNITYNFINTDVNGVYQVDMVNIPDYTAGTYVQDDVVVFGGQVWQNGNPTNALSPSVPNGWAIVAIASLRSALLPFDSGMNVTIDCIQDTAYRTLMYDTTTLTDYISVNATCSAITFTDTSNWVTNNEQGHALADFSDYRRIIITRPNLGQYVMSTIAGDDVDEIISPASSGNQDFTYTILDTDIDGRYQVSICEYPTWDSTPTYNYGNTVIVYYNGALYRALQNSTNQQPDTAIAYWELYEPTAAEQLVSRYCYIANISVLCISLNQCIETKLHEAICEIQSDFCNDDVLCKNRRFLAVNKLMLLKSGVNYSMNRRMWSEVDQDFNMMRQLCNC